MISIGQEVILKQYTTAQCPACPWDVSVGPQVVNKKYKVIGNNPRNYEGTVYNILVLERTVVTDPGPGLEWPEDYVKLSLGGGIS